MFYNLEKLDSASHKGRLVAVFGNSTENNATALVLSVKHVCSCLSLCLEMANAQPLCSMLQCNHFWHCDSGNAVGESQAGHLNFDMQWYP